jgi:glycosyltransferase involved in cell wall biosynthesis
VRLPAMLNKTAGGYKWELTVPTSRKLKIALIAPVWIRVPPELYGGIELVVGLLADGLAQRGHQVTLFASGDSITKARLISVFDRPQGHLIGQLLPEIYHVGAAYEFCRAEEFDIVHDHTLTGAVLGAYSRAPVLVTLHGAFTELSKPFYLQFKDSVYYNAISDYQRSRLPELNYVDTVYNTVDFDAIKLGTDKGGYLLSLSRVSSQKGTHLAVEAAKRLGRPLIIAGKIATDTDMAYFESQVEPQVDGRQIRFLGEVSEGEKRALMAGAACFLFPIQWAEPFGLVMLEAMAAGTPVVAFDHGSVREVIDHGRSGFIANNMDEFVEMTARAADIDPRDCRRHAERHFPVARMLDGYLRNYYRILRAEGRIVESATSA